MEISSTRSPPQYRLQPPTSSQLQLPPRQPHFPLSSPISAEIPTPNSSNAGKAPQPNPYDPFSTPPTPSDNPFADNESGDTSGQDEFALERYSEDLKRRRYERRNSMPKPTRGNSTDDAEGRKAQQRKERPGLNVVTDFSKSSGRAWTDGAVMKVNNAHHIVMDDRPDNHRSRSKDPSQGMQLAPNAAAAFVSLGDLKSLPKTKPKKVKDQRTTRNPENWAAEPKFPEQGKRPNARTYTAIEDVGHPDVESSLNGVKARAALRDFLHVGRERGPRAENPAINFVKRSDTVAKELSPSDRPIMIGISIPEHEYNHQSTSQALNDGPTQHTPATPSIIVTPAQDAAPWSHSPDEHFAFNKRKPPSSVYSRATDFNAPFVGLPDADAPPLPTFRKSQFFGNGVISANQRDSKVRNTSIPASTIAGVRQRSFSEGTLFDEDDGPQFGTRSRSSSNESKQGILERNSIDTLATRPRSKGWWNLMLSPMLSRSNTNASKMSPTNDNNLPPLPQLTTAEMAQKNRHFEEKDFESHFSPETPRRIGMKSGVTNWSRWSDWERERERERHETASVAENLRDQPSGQPASGHKAQESAATVPFMISASPVIEGAAAEYFQACAHDMISPEPYFECLNHVCKIQPVGREPEDRFSRSDLFGPSEQRVGPNEQSKRSPPLGNEEAENHLERPMPQIRANRFSAAFGEVSHHRVRSDSDSTVIEEDEPELSPNVREANAAPVMRARPPVAAALPAPPAAIGSTRSAPTPPPQVAIPPPAAQSTPIPPPYSPPRRITRFPAYVAILPPNQPAAAIQQPTSPGPVSPAMQRTMSSRGAIPMSEVAAPAQAAAPMLITNHHYNYTQGLPPRPPVAPVSLADIGRPVAVRRNAEAKRQRLEKEDAVGKKVGGLWRGRGCFSKKGCFGRGGPEGRVKRRWYVIITTALVLMIIAVVALATTLTRKGDHTPVQSQWLNLTGFPPMPTGISTIAQPDAAVENAGCIQPSEMWSCALPKEDQAQNAPNDADQPNFRIEIRFRNGTFDNSTTAASNASKRSIHSRRSLLRRHIHLNRDAFTDDLYDPSPAAPSVSEQIFLGNTTDNNTAPFQGENTPFYISVVSPAPVSAASRLLRRQDSSNDNSTSPSNSSTTFPDLSNLIPSPSTSPNGTAAAATLIPFPLSQPVHLYNRGLDTEHYGFYTYFDRSIFLSTSINSTSDDTSSTDADGGAPISSASMRCTWAQTRFLVQIWTSPASGMNLLSPPPNNGTKTAKKPSSSTNSSATNFQRPGSFPYPVSITLDRHGGDENKKMVYCYGMDGQEHIISNQKAFELEDRGFGGTLVNPATGLFNVTGNGSEEAGVIPGWKGAGGVDGGTGGCECQWRNWLQTQ